MKRFAVMIICLLVTFVSPILDSVSFAATASVGSPPTEPPYGLKIEGAVAGTKLSGVMVMEYIGRFDTVEGRCDWYHCPSGPYASYTCADGEVTLRLRSGNEIKTIFVYGQSFPIGEASVIQDFITKKIEGPVLNAFGFDSTKHVVLAQIGDYYEYEGDRCGYEEQDPNDPTKTVFKSRDSIIVVDITLAVK